VYDVAPTGSSTKFVTIDDRTPSGGVRTAGKRTTFLSRTGVPATGPVTL
jgi:hypothetical protein